jgi:ParB family chromosome partitioning protein
MTTSHHQLIPFSSLFLSPRNARKTKPSHLEAMAASILHSGILQNLVVTPELVDGAATGRFEVNAGGRRWRAIKINVERGAFAEDYPTPCLVRDNATALEDSVAENTMREPMHPADEFEAFKEMVDQGVQVEDVAARFGVTPLVVLRRLKLANVSPKMIQIYRAGEASLEQLMAMAITDDHKAQERVWKENPTPWQRKPESLRRLLAKGEVEVRGSSLAKLVGIEAYEAAGGRVERDLFSDAGNGYLSDQTLLQQLADAKLEAIASEVRSEGWSWVEVDHEFRSYHTYRYGSVMPANDQPTKAQKKELDALQRERDACVAAMDALESNGLEDSEAWTEQDEQLDAIQGKITALNTSFRTWADADKAKAGAIVSVDDSGTPQIFRGLVQKAASPGGASAASGTAKEAKPKKPALSESLARRLTAHRTAALQLHLVEQPHIALAVLVHSLVSRLFRKGQHYAGAGSAVHAQVENKMEPLPSIADDLKDTDAWKKLQKARGEILAGLPKSEKDLLPHLIALPQQDLLQLLALCTATGTSAVQTAALPHAADAVAEAVELDMAQWWTATPASYLNHVSKALAVEAVVEATSKKDAESLATMKKDQLAKAAAVKLGGTGWLPKILRGPTSPKKTTKPTAARTHATKAAPKPKAIQAKKVTPTTKRPASIHVRYRDDKGNTWTGRGKRPAWVSNAIAEGKSLASLLAQ